MLGAVPKSKVVARVLSGDLLECQVESPAGERLALTGKTSDVEPETLGSPHSGATVPWSAMRGPSPSSPIRRSTCPLKRNRGTRRGERRPTKWWWNGSPTLLTTSRSATSAGWCSSCFEYVDHRKGKRPVGQMPAYLCSNCGSPTLPCATPPATTWRCGSAAQSGCRGTAPSTAIRSRDSRKASARSTRSWTTGSSWITTSLT